MSRNPSFMLLTYFNFQVIRPQQAPPNIAIELADFVRTLYYCSYKFHEHKNLLEAAF